MEENLDSYHAIVVDGDSTRARFRRGPAPPVTVSVTQRQNRKFITKVCGLEAYGVNMEEFSRSAQKIYACACSVVQGVKQEELQIQGNVGSDVVNQLVNDFGIPSSLVHLKKL